MNCLGYYMFAFGKLKVGIRENFPTVEQQTIQTASYDASTIALRSAGSSSSTWASRPGSASRSWRSIRTTRRSMPW